MRPNNNTYYTRKGILHIGFCVYNAVIFLQAEKLVTQGHW